MPKYSIVIPTYKHLDDCLKPCIEGIIQNTDLQDVEVIIVANGCGNDGTSEYVQKLGSPFRLVWLDEPSGFTHSTNVGIDIAKGDYIVLMNNDNIITGKGWLEMLSDPLEADAAIGITGAAKNYHIETKTEFLLFFCVMLRRSTLDEIGLLDETFNPGYGEDIDYCHKLKRAGYKLVQVPNDLTLNDLRKDHTLKFPLWHKSSVTVHEVPTWKEVVPRNEKILFDRYHAPIKNLSIGTLLDRVAHAEVPSNIDRLMSIIPDGGVIRATLDKRTSVTLSKTGYAHHIFLGVDGLYNTKIDNTVPDVSSLETIREHVLNSGSKSSQFGGRWEGGYCTQQDPEEISSFLDTFKDLNVDSYLEIGCADGGVTRLFCDVVDVKDVTTIDIGWADANYPYTYRNNIINLRNSGKIDIFRGDSHSKDAEQFLQEKQFDFVFIDADHTYDSVVKDTMLAMKHAKPGAIFAYHDHLAVEEIGNFYKDMCSGKFPEFEYVKSYGSKFGISTFRYTGVKQEEKKMEEIGRDKYRKGISTSIIIPTYNHLEDCLKPCIKSIINTTDLSSVEVIVVANGCTDDTRQYVQSLGNPFKLIWIDDQVGFIKATNEGIKAAKGKYIILLNNDTEVLNSSWINILKEPFSNPKVGMTGPYKDWRFFWDNNRLIFRTEYMVFYCAMIRKEIFDKIGLLDEDFGMGYEEDIDFAIRLKKAGYKIVQVPNNIEDHLGITKSYLIDNPNNNFRLFPVIHKDKMTFQWNLPNFTKKTSLLQKYREKPLISIIIPTYNHVDYLKNCLESIREYTDLQQIEVIVVANGCTDETREYVQSLGGSFKLLWINERVGYIKATNAGIQQAMGDYIILMNNDVVLSPQEKDTWIKMLTLPFFDEKVGLTGPIKAWRDDIKAEYLLFWCVMIRRTVIDKIGMLDEMFGEGYHEDVDFCIRAYKAGFKLVEVPNDIEYSEQFKGDPNRDKLFPISHIGGGTFAPMYGNDPERLMKRLNILYEKHVNGPLPDGFFGRDDQEFYRKLVNTIPEGGAMAEIGVWKGTSLCSVADIIRSKNITVAAVDTFEGSPWEGEKGAFTLDKDKLQNEFRKNIERFGIEKNTTVFPLSSLNAPKLIPDGSLDLVFLDGDHRYESVQADIKAWLPKLKPSGWLAGHDILWNDSVGPAVRDIFGEDKVYSYSNLWYIIPENKGTVSATKPNIYDCCTFFNELDVLEIRLNELDSVVDRFVICEARFTHQGSPKPLYFEQNLERFSKFLNKITYVIVDDFSNCVTSWDRENFQRNCIIRGLASCKDTDIIIMSDVDEILRADTVRKYTPEMGVTAVEMPLFYYKLNWKADKRWFKPRIFPFSELKGKDVQHFRGGGDYDYKTTLNDGGWHFSFLGDKDSVKHKIQSYAHEEFNNDNFTNDKNLQEAIEEGKDIFKRDIQFTKIDIGESYPKFVRDNIKEFTEKGLILPINDSKSKIYDCFSFFNELDLLEIRLNELDPHVDYFILSEMTQTHSGNQKPLHFYENRERFSKFLHKIICVVPPDIQTDDPWMREHYQRDYMIHILNERCSDNDVVIVSDLDEIPRGGNIKKYNRKTPMFFYQNQYSYYLNYNVGISPIAEGTFSRITTYDYLKINKLSLTGLRYLHMTENEGIDDGGWHFSWMGGANKIVDKLKSWAHQEFNKPELLNPHKIEHNITQGKEHFGRAGVGETKKVTIDSSFPNFIQENQDYLRSKGLLDNIPDPKVAIIMPYYNDDRNLLRSVAGITGQTYQNWELFIVDDGSNFDKKASKILASHPKIHIIEKYNGGPSSARNMALDEIGKGFSHIAFCDSDDVWDSNLLVANLSKIGDSDMVYCSVNHRFEDGSAAYPYGIPDPVEYPGRQVMLETPFIFISSVLCKREAIGFNRFDSELDSIEDWEMWLRLDKQGKKICHNPEKLVTYTVKNGMAAKRTDEQVNIIHNRYRVKGLV